MMELLQHVKLVQKLRERRDSRIAGATLPYEEAFGEAAEEEILIIIGSNYR